MAVSTRRIKEKISTVNNIRKITKAMEAVAASKTKSSIERALNAREYAMQSLSILRGLTKDRFVNSPLFHDGTGTKHLIVMVSSNKGLCGSFNVNLGRTISSFINNHKENGSIDVIAVGKKAETYALRKELPLIGSFLSIPDRLHIDDIAGLNHLIQEQFLSGEYKRVSIAYTHYQSPLALTPIMRQLLPLVPEILKDLFTHVSEKTSDENSEKKQFSLYLFEPDAEVVLQELLPRLTLDALYHAILESYASEHSARRIAMKNATDNAGDLSDELTLLYNNARQASVTQEISEISAGAEALRSS